MRVGIATDHGGPGRRRRRRDFGLMRQTGLLLKAPGMRPCQGGSHDYRASVC
jgi:hypothetical protein